MSNHFIQSVLIQDEAQAADGTVTKDLPINPLSHILLTVKAANNTPLASESNYSVMAQLLSMITRVEVLFRGSAIISASLRDLAVLYMVLTGRQPWQTQVDDIDNNIRSVTIPIMFGRDMFLRDECFPASKKGELTLQLTTDVALTGLDTLILQAETVELVDAMPNRYLKATIASKTPSAVQEEDFDLPIGNVLAGVVLFSNLVPTGAVYTTSIDNLQLLINNQQKYFPRTNWESLHGALTQRLSPLTLSEHSHRLVRNGTAGTALQAVSIAAAAGSAVTGGVGETVGGSSNIGSATGIMSQVIVADWLENYAYLDLDPTGDLSFAQDTLGLSRIHMRINHGDTGAIRALPVELVGV